MRQTWSWMTFPWGKGGGALSFLRTAGQQGTKIEDELPVPHHSGYVEVQEEEPVYSHQKIKE